MTGLQLILSVAASFCLPGFGQLYQYTLTKADDRLDLAFKIQVVCAVCIGLSMMGVGLLFSWFVIPVAWLIGFVESVLWALRQPQSPPLRPVVVLLALCGLLGGASAQAYELPLPLPARPASWGTRRAEAQVAELARCGCGCDTCGSGKCAKRGSPCCTLCACAIEPADETFDPTTAPPVKTAKTTKRVAPACQGGACQNSRPTALKPSYRGRTYQRRGWIRGGCRGCG